MEAQPVGQVPVPKVFLSHATEDKQRFVLDFATKLRSAGVEVWLDRWEMYPGDSLVDKIFEEGIKDAQAMIIVLSSNSVNKPWVREELNAGIVKKISDNCKVIPVVIDECEIPEALRSTFYERIEDLEHYDPELERIVMSVFGYREKPPLGSPPAYASNVTDFVQGLDRVDSLALKLSCEQAIKEERNQIGTDETVELLTSLNVPEEDARDAIEILDRSGYIDGTRLMPIGLAYYSVTAFGFDQYAKAYLEGYEQMVQSVALRIVQNGDTTNEAISNATDMPMILVDFILDVFAFHSFVTVHKFMGGGSMVSNISPNLRRRVRDT